MADAINQSKIRKVRTELAHQICNADKLTKRMKRSVPTPS